MSDSDLMRKSLNIINESFLEDDKEKKSKRTQDSDYDFDRVPEDKEKDTEDAHKKHKERFSNKDESVEEDDSENETKNAVPKKEDDSDATRTVPKKESTPKDSAQAPKSTSPSNVDWAKHGFPGMGEGIYEGEEIEEGVNITLDGKEADDFVARLMQLSGQPAQVPAHAASTPTSFDAEPIPFDMDGAPAMGIDEPAGIPIDQPDVDADHYVCDSCECDPCECDSIGLTSMEETAEYDNVNADATDNIEEIDDDSYIWKPIVTPQRMVKGTMGDNPMIQRESIERFNKFLKEYNSFLNEGTDSNEDGISSPLTKSDRQDFDKDPYVSKTPKDDGSMSPMSQIKRQKIMK